MKLSDWLDKKEAENVDMSQIMLPVSLVYNKIPDEIIFFKMINHCGFFCIENHPFCTVERFGNWYYSRGQDKKAGVHSSEMEWQSFTKDKTFAIKTAKMHIE